MLNKLLRASLLSAICIALISLRSEADYLSAQEYEVTYPEANVSQADLPIVGLSFRTEGERVAKQEIRFVAEIAGGTNVNFRWDFGDNSSPVSGQEVVHTYAARGNYDVTLIAENNVSIKTITSQIDVRKNPLPPPSIFISGDLKVGQSVRFDAQINSTENVRFTWDFGDGEDEPRTGNPVFHIYDFAGTFVVTVDAVNSQDPTDRSSATELISIVDEPIPGFLEPPSIVTTPNTQGKYSVDVPVTFSAEVAAGTDVRYRWNFGDGTATVTTRDTTIQHTYQKAGIYKVTVNAFNSNSNVDNSIDNPLFIEVQPKLTPLSDPVAFCLIQQELERTIYCGAFVDQGNPANFTWEFSDGTIKRGPIVHHTYAKDGKYNVLTIATNDHPTDNYTWAMQVVRIVSLSQPDEPRGGAPVDFLMIEDVQISENPVAGSSTWYVLVHPVKDAVQYEWDFGDGSESVVAEGQNNLSASHIYEEPGLYVVTIKVVDANGQALQELDYPVLINNVIRVPLMMAK